MIDRPLDVIAHPTSLDREWLVTNALGGFAMGAINGAATRRYHGLLIAAANPPVERLVALHSIHEEIDGAHGPIGLAAQEFGDPPVLYADGCRWAETFERRHDGVRWTYQLDDTRIVKQVTLARASNRAVVRYEIESPRDTTLRLRPLTPLRSFHELDHHHADGVHNVGEIDDGGLQVRRGDLVLTLRASVGVWTIEPHWWRNLAYRAEAARGQSWIEDVWSPGRLEVPVPANKTIAFTVDAQLVEPLVEAPAPIVDIGRGDDRRAALTRAADQFIARRRIGGVWRPTILAGFPWFADWGRDAMICVEGLLLCSGRHDEAAALLTLFAEHERDGLIPNRFDDHGGDPHYNTADAALWFVHAAGRLAEYTSAAPPAVVIDAVRAIIDGYQHGAGHGVRMDGDGLIIADDPDAALTWMDAKRGDVIFTPRHGKPVELSALWFNALHVAADLLAEADPAFAARQRTLGRRVAHAFNESFWDDDAAHCADVLVRDHDGGWRPDRAVRPNQVFAVSLPHSPLSLERQRGVAASLRRSLMTPFGLRTLAPDDPAYRGRYEGDLGARDAAYHQGTVWPWLIGPYCDAVIRTSASAAEAVIAVNAAVDPLRRELGAACLGQLAEVYDGDPPHRPSGCPAQAWSIAELLRIEHRLDQLRRR